MSYVPQPLDYLPHESQRDGVARWRVTQIDTTSGTGGYASKALRLNPRTLYKDKQDCFARTAQKRNARSCYAVVKTFRRRPATTSVTTPR